MASKEEKASKAESPTAELQQVQDLYDLMVREKLDYLELKENDAVIRLARQTSGRLASTAQPHFHPGTPVSAPVSLPPTTEPVPPPTNYKVIPSPLAGVFYRASSPTTPPFAREGDVVESGQTLCIVEAMKVMNEIKTDSRGKIVKIVAENGRPVTAGQALFHLEPA